MLFSVQTYHSYPEIGDYDLPLKGFHNIKIVFHNVSKLFCQQNDSSFIVTKFLSIGTNIKLRRVYATDDLQVDMKIKPAINISFGRTNLSNKMASFMFCDDHVRVNHYYLINKDGIVSYNLKSKFKIDEEHDLDLVMHSADDAILFSIDWNGKFQAEIAMSSKTLIIN